MRQLLYLYWLYINFIYFFLISMIYLLSGLRMMFSSLCNNLPFYIFFHCLIFVPIYHVFVNIFLWFIYCMIVLTICTYHLSYARCLSQLFGVSVLNTGWFLFISESCMCWWMFWLVIIQRLIWTCFIHSLLRILLWFLVWLNLIFIYL